MAYPGRRKWCVVFDGTMTTIVSEETADAHYPEFGRSEPTTFEQARQEALKYLRSQRDGYRLAIKMLNNSTTKDFD